MRNLCYAHTENKIPATESRITVIKNPFTAFFFLAEAVAGGRIKNDRKEKIQNIGRLELE